MADAFTATHAVPDGGLPAWAEPDAAAAAVSRLDPALPVRLLEQRADGWAKVLCANGWSAWVDGRRLRDLRPLRVVPGGGLPAWTTPDPSATAASTLAAGLEVRLCEQRGDGWAHVLCSNGWSGWVDGRRLVAPSAARGTISWLPPGAGLASLVGAALVLLGGFLPWATGGGASVSAWDLPLGFLFSSTAQPSSIHIGLVLLPVVLVALPLLTHKRLPNAALVTIAALAGGAAGDVFGRVLQAGGANPGIGLFLTMIGGGLIAADPAIEARAWTRLSSVTGGSR